MVFQKLHLILCDREEERQVLEGVRYEIQDCIFQNVASKTNEPWHEIPNNVCATSKASDQPAHKHSLVRGFASRLNII